MYNYEEELNKINIKDMYDLFGVKYEEESNQKNEITSIRIIVVEKEKEYKIELEKNLLIDVIKEIFSGKINIDK